MQIIIQNYISFKISALKAEPKGLMCFESMKNMLTYKNPKYITALRYGYSVFKIDKYIRLYHVLGDEIFIFRGEFNNVMEHFGKFKVKIHVTDFTQVYEKVKIIRKPKYDLMPSQQDAYDAVVGHIENGVTQGVVLANTSFGKSYWLLHLAHYLQQPLLVLCHTTGTQRQWVKDELIGNCGLTMDEIGGAGGMFKKPVVKNVNVALYHSMCKKPINSLFKNKIGFLGIDEVQKAAIQQMRDAINPFRSRYRFGQSAGIDRKDGMRFVIEALCGSVVYQAPEEESDSKIMSKIFRTNTNWSPIEAENHVAVITEASRDAERNRRIARSAVRQARQGRITIIFVERKEQAAVLAKLLSNFHVHLLIGDVPKDQISEMDISDRAKEYLLNNDANAALDNVKAVALKRELDIIIATQKAEVGLSIETLDHEIITTPIGNNQERFVQVKGRVERKHKDKRLKLFGEKKTPTVEVMVDNEEGSIKAWDLIEECFPDDIIENPYSKKERNNIWQNKKK